MIGIPKADEAKLRSWENGRVAKYLRMVGCQISQACESGEFSTEVNLIGALIGEVFEVKKRLRELGYKVAGDYKDYHLIKIDWE